MKSVQQKIESMKKLKDQGAKALLPMMMQQVSGSNATSALGQAFGDNGFVASNNQNNPLRNLTNTNIVNQHTKNIQSPYETFL
ncbi:hypothetical protein NDM229_015990 [Acinetobacter bereziniae]|nr:hypothetical protein [Acinetobacter bereziniae]RSZ27366.1 hypothetical protein NDM229_015990 [Acinetobacter bereziniae]